MKIERINDNQIRCTLTTEDLLSRHLKIDELAYGTENAKNLFREMMGRANSQFGFQAEDIPILIEAVPVPEGLILMITKVEDPEELDTRFARFAPSVYDIKGEDTEEDEDSREETPSEVMDLFKKIQEFDHMLHKPAPADHFGQSASGTSLALFCFKRMPLLLTAAGIIREYPGRSSLYKDERSRQYLLLVEQDPEQSGFSKICNHLSEYGGLMPMNPSTPAYLKEHCLCLIERDALQKLAQIR